MQHQPHEAFFSFTVPPKPVSLNPHLPSSSVPLSSYHHPASLLSSIVTDLDRPPQPSSHHDLASRSPSSVSPIASSLNRPNTAGPFAFNVPSSTTPSSTATRFSSIHPPTSASSAATSVERPFSSSDVHIINSSFPPPISNTQAPCSSSHATSHDAHQSSAQSNHTHLTSRPSQPPHPPPPLPAPAHMSHHAINIQSVRPMTAPGPSWVGGHHLLDSSFDFPSAHVGLFDQGSSHPFHHDSLSGSLPPKSTSQQVSSNINHAIDSSPGSSSLIVGSVESLTQAPLGSSSGSSHLQSRPSASHSLEPLDSSDHTTSPIRCHQGPGRASLGGRSSDSSPESPDSSDADQIHPHGYLHALAPSHLKQAVRPSTHSGTTASFGQLDRCISQNVHRPMTGYSHMYDLAGSYASINAVGNSYVHRPSVFSGHSSHPYATSPGHYSYGPGSIDSSGHERLYNFNILPGAPRKRARRRFDEVERLYDCNYPGCTKAYGTLNHLNAHITMQKHGPKRLPQEFKEIRKEWRARKKAEAEARALVMKQSVSHLSCNEYGILGGPEAFRQNTSAVSNDSSPSSSSAGGGLTHHLLSPAARGPYSAPPLSRQFSLSDSHPDWYSPDHHRVSSTIIDEQPEYLGSVSSHDSSGSLLPPQVSGSPSGGGSIPHRDQPLSSSPNIIGLPLSHGNRNNSLMLNRPSSLVE